MGLTRKDSTEWISTIGGVLLALLILAAAIPAESAGSGAYPVRLCSPEAFRGDGSGGTFGTGNTRIEGVRSYVSRNGNLSYGDPGYWTLWHPILQCGALNTNNAGQFNYGMRMFTFRDAGWQKGHGGGMEIVPPADTTIAQVSFRARALMSPANGAQGGLGGGGTKMVWEFVGAPAGAGIKGEAVPSHTAFGSFGQAGAVQTASAYRIGQICEPSNGGTICFGPGESVLIQDLLVTVHDRIKPNVSIVDTPISTGSWVSGQQRISYLMHDGQSGIRETEVFVGGKQIHSKTHPCATVNGLNAGDASVPMAAHMKPCSNEIEGETVTIDTRQLGDGEHNVKVCARDFASATSYWGQDPPACVTRSIRVDNSPPVAPEGMEAISTRIPRAVEPNDISWDDPGTGDPGAPIMSATYEVVDRTGKAVVPTQTIRVDGDPTVPANSNSARNIESLPTIKTPIQAGNYTLKVRLTDTVGHTSRVASITLRYSCHDSGAGVLPEANVALGLVRHGYHDTTASARLALRQGAKATLLGRVRGPGGMPVTNANTCVNAKPVTDPQPSLLANVKTDGQGQYRLPLKPGPSRNLVAVVRQGHRESWSEQALTRVRVRPALRLRSKKIRAGQTIHFRGRIPGPRNDRVTVVLQAKVGKGWQAFRTYRTRADGKYRLRYKPRAGHLTRPTKFVVRAVVPLQSGYPYQGGSSGRRVVVVSPMRR